MRATMKSFRVRLIAFGIFVVVILLLAGGVFVVQAQAQATPQQPVPFPHVNMVQSGIPCLFCHADAIRSPTAGIPSVEKCMGCHKFIATNTPAIQKVADYYQRGQPIPWVRVNRLPRFVYFSHQVHVVAGALNCERCHGDVGRMTEFQPVARMTMGWCLNCHNAQPEADRLKDCVVCHR